MKRVFKPFVIFCVCLLSVSMLFAGGSGESSESRELNVLYSGTPQIQEREYLLNTFYPDFEEATGIKVNVNFVTQADAITLMETQQSTGNITYDVAYVDTANMAPYVNGGWMEDITAIIDESGSTYTTMFDQTTNKDGVRYFVPNAFDVYVLIANTRALEYLPEGLTEEDVINGISWEQYADWAIAIKEGTGVGRTMFPASQTGSQLLYPMGGMVLAYGGTFPEMNTENAKEAWVVIAEMAAAGALYAQEDQYSAVTDPMNAGDVWLAFSHMTPAGQTYNAAPNSFVIGAAPHGDTGAGSTSGAWCYGIVKGTPNLDEAQEFISYITQPEVNYDVCINNGAALSPIVEVGDIMTDEDVLMRAGNRILESAIVAGVPSTEYSDWNAVKLLYHDIFDSILATGEVPSQKFLDNCQATLESLHL